MNNLSYFTTSTINRNTKNIGVMAEHKSKEARLYGFKKEFYMEILDIIINSSSIKLSLEEQKIIKNFIFKAKTAAPKIRQVGKIVLPVMIRDAYRKYFFDSTLNADNFDKTAFLDTQTNITLINRDKNTGYIRLEHNLWVFILELNVGLHLNKNLDYDNSLLYFKPHFYSIDRNLNTHELKNTSEITKKVLHYIENKDRPCPCLTSNSSFEDCCYSLFLPVGSSTPTIFGFTYKNFTKAFKDNIKVEGKILEPMPTEEIILKIKEREPLGETFRYMAQNMRVPITSFSENDFTNEEEKIEYSNVKLEEKIEEIKHKIAGSLSLDSMTVWCVLDQRNVIVVSAMTEKEINTLIESMLAKHLLEEYLSEIDKILSVLLKKENEDSILSWLSGLEDYIKPRLIKLVKSSYGLYQNGQEEEALYILIPQIEAVLRDASIGLVDSKIMVTEALPPSRKSHSRSYLTLSPLIDSFIGLELPEMSMESRFGRKAVKTIFKQILTKNGLFLNIRNELSHGFEGRGFNTSDYRTVFYLFILLSIGFYKKDSN